MSSTRASKSSNLDDVGRLMAIIIEDCSISKSDGLHTRKATRVSKYELI